MLLSYRPSKIFLDQRKLIMLKCTTSSGPGQKLLCTHLDKIRSNTRQSVKIMGGHAGRAWAVEESDTWRCWAILMMIVVVKISIVIFIILMVTKKKFSRGGTRGRGATQERRRGVEEKVGG